jgi:hypothetical protein
VLALQNQQQLNVVRFCFEEQKQKSKNPFCVFRNPHEARRLRLGRLAGVKEFSAAAVMVLMLTYA